MRPTCILIVAVGILVGLPPAGVAGQRKHCKPVAAGEWKATHISVVNTSCKSVRNKLRRWLRREQLPHNRDGWFCESFSVVRGTNRQCSSIEPKVVGFFFRKRHR